MKKRNSAITALSLVAVLALVIFVQPLQSFAVNALSVFRVQDVHAINITVDDIQQLAGNAQELLALMPDAGEKDGPPADEFADMAEEMDSLFVRLDSPADFTAFDLKLPRALEAETPELRMIDTWTQTVTLNTGEVNPVLAQLGAEPLPDELDGAQVTVRTPATVIAVYSEDILIATQMPVFSGDGRVLSALSRSLLSLPLWSDHLREQLAGVDLTSGIVYVPVIEGFGQRTTVRGSTGYLYAMSDLSMLLSSLDFLPSGEGENPLVAFQSGGGDANALVWTQNGVLYILAGSQPAGELTQIARSVG